MCSYSAPIATTESAQLLYAQPLGGMDDQWVEINEVGDLILTDPCCDGFAYEWSRGQ